ncbi:MAG: hypothetical protein COT84_07750 [Chlamydiae bacterium CG10_big_fil_rev_8_21_14_0_10_35_9]|nr:MAG: hypothetical protein COT84_07750 [Chlamydiae bacterium CG10_big_fil_rev_8_21_14_0_10_35_9]
MLWLTDLHIDFKEKEAIDVFLKKVSKVKSDGICITGDIGEKGESINFIKKLSEITKLPIYFILGNHDFYGFKIEEFQAKVHLAFIDNARIFYLNSHHYVPLSNNAAIVGIDNWYDLSQGDFFASPVIPKDFKEIQTFSTLNKNDLFSFIQDYSHKIIDQLNQKLVNAFASFSNVILLAHFPPFKEVCLYNNTVADDNWAPFFVQGLLGDFLKTFMSENPDKCLTVLSGHTHHIASYKPTHNLTIKVGSCPNNEINWDTISF